VSDYANPQRKMNNSVSVHLLRLNISLEPKIICFLFSSPSAWGESCHAGQQKKNNEELECFFFWVTIDDTITCENGAEICKLKKKRAPPKNEILPNHQLPIFVSALKKCPIKKKVDTHQK
jgi:hypothetical protein